jgi:3-hydroxyacyl-CoA dehydrogenase
MRAFFAENLGMSQVQYAVKGSIAVIGFQSPPVNSLSFPLRKAMLSALDRALSDTAVKAVVLVGANGTFCAGADIREFNKPEMAAVPTLWNLISAIEASPKPVVAAIEGVALGGGLELALGCHYRVVLDSAKVGLPEVKLGLLPGAGGTQRLPRLLGVENALNVILAGEPLPVALFAKSPLFDQVVSKDLEAAALALADKATATAAEPNLEPRKRLPRVRDKRVKEPNLEALAQFARNTVKAGFPQYPAPLAIVNAVAAAAKSKTFDEGLAEEQRLFKELLLGNESAALRHIFFAERATQKIADVPETTPTRAIKSVAVIGAGTMGGGISINFLNAGIPVHLLELKQDALDRGVAKIRETYEGQVKKGRLKPDDAQKRMGLLKPTLSYAEIGQADLVIEAVFEDMGVKQKVFETLDATMKPGAILASNTSTLDLDKIAAFTKRPQDVIGLHFFSPANVMKLLEVVRGAKTGKDVLATSMKLAKQIKKTAVVSGVCDGFIGNRMINEYFREALAMVDEGASPPEVDAAIERFGFAMGPFRMSDLAGNDIGWHIRKRQYEEGKLKTRAIIADKINELGRFGQKSGAGWYDYKPGDRNAYPSEVVAKTIEEGRKSLGQPTRKVPAEEIVDRLVYSLVNEGARILEEKIAQRASDIDMVYLTGYGFPIWRGGPMFYADTVGLFDVVQRMKALAANPRATPGSWTPAPLLAKLAAEGGRFSGTV